MLGLAAALQTFEQQHIQAQSTELHTVWRTGVTDHFLNISHSHIITMTAENKLHSP